RRDQHQVVSPHRDQPGLQATLRAQAGDADPRLGPPQGIGERQRRLDVTGTAASRDYHAHRQASSSTVGRRAHSRRRSRPSQLRTRRAAPGSAAASASLAPGSRLANDISMPSATIVTISDDRPDDTSGSGTPVMGSSPSTAPMLTSAWATIQAVAPAAASRTKVSRARP